MIFNPQQLDEIARKAQLELNVKRVELEAKKIIERDNGDSGEHAAELPNQSWEAWKSMGYPTEDIFDI